MQFIKSQVDAIAAGTVTLTFRKWTRPQAKVGGRYRTWGHLLEAVDVRTVPAREITDQDAHRAGEASAATVRERLGVSGDDEVYRIEFRHLGRDDRIDRRNDATLDDGRRASIEARLDRLDRASKSGPWTRKTLHLIGTNPGVVSTRLAEEMGTDRPAFKINVRKLKELGLTESLEIGYRLSPLGEAFTGSTRVIDRRNA
jgi:hypothetical protein